MNLEETLDDLSMQPRAVDCFQHPHTESLQKVDNAKEITFRRDVLQNNTLKTVQVPSDNYS
jgi:hypothetical protein